MTGRVQGDRRGRSISGGGGRGGGGSSNKKSRETSDDNRRQGHLAEDFMAKRRAFLAALLCISNESMNAMFKFAPGDHIQSVKFGEHHSRALLAQRLTDAYIGQNIASECLAESTNPLEERRQGKVSHWAQKINCQDVFRRSVLFGAIFLSLLLLSVYS